MIRVGRQALAITAALLAVSLITSGVSAQQRRPGMGQGPPNREELERRVRARFAEMMQQRLGLSDEQSDQLNGAVESFMQRRQRLVADEQALRRRMQAIALEAEPTDAEARSLLARMQELRDEEVGLFRAEQEALLAVLTPVQLVRFHAMREQLGQRIQQLRGGQGPGPGRPGAGPPAAGFRDGPWEGSPPER